MNYTNLVLMGLGLLGVLLHNLVKINDLNKNSQGNVNLAQYLKLERFSILISIIVVGCCVMVKGEIKQLEAASKFLGIGFVALGYMAQSVLVNIMGKASKVIGNDDEPKKD